MSGTSVDGVDVALAVLRRQKNDHPVVLVEPAHVETKDAVPLGVLEDPAEPRPEDHLLGPAG